MAGSASRLCPMLAPLTDIDSLRMSTSHQQPQQSFAHRMLRNFVTLGVRRYSLSAVRRDLPSTGRASVVAGLPDRTKDASPDRRTLRTVFRDTFRSRAISLIVLPVIKSSRRIRAIVSTTSIPHHLLPSKAGSATGQPIGGRLLTPIPQLRGSKLHAETHQHRALARVVPVGRSNDAR